MPIIANNITDVRIKIETKEPGQLQGIQVTPAILKIEEKKVNNQNYLMMHCNLIATYFKAGNAPLGQFLVSEELLFSADEKDIKEIVKSWADNKKLPSKIEKDLIQSITTVCMYDLQFFTNKMKFPPAIGYKFPEMDLDKKKEGKKKKK